MTHLSPDERLDLIEAGGEPAHPHLESCAACRAEVARLRALLHEARRVDVPEPSPLFWERFSRQVSEAVSASGARPGRVGWPFWRVLVPLGAAVGALLVAVGVGRGPGPLPVPVAPAMSAELAGGVPVAEVEDEHWTVLAALAAEFDVETLSDSLGRPAASGADAVVWQLNAQERAELGALLRAEFQQRP